MNKPVTVFVDSGKAVARLSGPLVLGDTYAVAFSGLSTEEAASAPEMIVLGPKLGEIAARSEDGVLAMTTKPCVEAFGPLPPPPLPRPKQFPHPPPLPNPPVHWRGGPHGSTRMHFYVVAGGQTLAQGDLVLLWAPFEFDEAGEPIQLRGKKGDPGEKGDKGDQGEPGRNGVYVAMDGLYAFHISEGGDHPEDGHLWLHAQDESTLYAHDANGNYLLDENGERIPLYYVGNDGHLRYRFFFQDSTHVELDLGKVVTREGLYAFHVSDGSDGEPAGHLMLHGQDLSQLYARDGQGNLILDGDGNPIPLFHIDANGHLHFTFYGNDGQAHESLDLGDVRGTALTWDDLTPEQKASLKGETGTTGAQGPKGDPLTWSDLTPEQKAALKGAKGDPGEDGMTEEEIVALVKTTMGEADDAPTAGSQNWVTSGGLWSVEQAILARILALATRLDALREKIGAALRFKGSVQTKNDLPENADLGDVYNVVAEGGMNYAWTGSEWDALGATIDLSAYRTATAQDTIDDAQNAAIVAIAEKAADAASIAPAFSTSSTYAVGDYVTHEGLLYKCTTAVSTAGAWNAANWTAVSAMGEMPSGGAPSHNIWAASCTSSNGVAYVATPYGGDFSLVDGAMIVFEIPKTNASDPTINVGGTGAKNIYEVSEGIVWRVPAGTMRKGAFCILQYDSSHTRWVMHGYASINSAVLRYQPKADNLAVGTDSASPALADGYPSLASGNNAKAHALNSVALGQAVYADGQAAFACNQGGDAAGFGSFSAGRRSITAQSGSPGSASSPHAYAFAWQGDVSGGSAAYYYSHGDGTFNVKPVPASGSTDPATGFWIGETKLSDYVRYAFSAPTPTVSGTTATVACEDRAINDFTVATGITSLTITPPAAVTGRARDFFCRVTLTDSSLPTVTLSGGTIDIGASEVAGMTQGVNLLMFTEIASGHWLASRRSAS